MAAKINEIETIYTELNRAGASGMELAKNVQKMQILLDDIINRYEVILNDPVLLANFQNYTTQAHQDYAAALHTLLTQLKTDIDALG